jgi:hypothetical protein
LRRPGGIRDTGGRPPFMVWRETIFPKGRPESYIDYLQEVGLLRRGVIPAR